MKGTPATRARTVCTCITIDFFPITLVVGGVVVVVIVPTAQTMVLALRRGVEAEAVPSARVGEALARDMRGLLNNEKLSDVTFIVEGRPLHAHRCILSVRCEPLDSMLDGGMREAQQREVVLEDVRFDAFLSFLEYLYTDHVEALASPSFSVDAALDLLTIADRFLVEHLKRLCEVAIQRTISVDNVATMLEVVRSPAGGRGRRRGKFGERERMAAMLLVFVSLPTRRLWRPFVASRQADSRNASALRARCFDFILSNFGRVIATKAFTELPQPLLREVLLEASRRRPFLRG